MMYVCMYVCGCNSHRVYMVYMVYIYVCGCNSDRQGKMKVKSYLQFTPVHTQSGRNTHTHTYYGFRDMSRFESDTDGRSR